VTKRYGLPIPFEIFEIIWHLLSRSLPPQPLGFRARDAKESN
jgi:hypothetical protein